MSDAELRRWALVVNFGLWVGIVWIMKVCL
jgi:hypothetical protein